MGFVKCVIIVLLLSMYFIAASCGQHYEACYEDEMVKLIFAVNSSNSRPTIDRNCCGSPVILRHGETLVRRTLVPVVIESDCTYCEKPLYSSPKCFVCMQPLALSFGFVYDKSNYSLTIEEEPTSETSSWMVRISITVPVRYTSFVSRIIPNCNRGDPGAKDETPNERGDQDEKDISTKEVSYKHTGVTSAAAIAGWCVAIGLGCALVALFIQKRMSKAQAVDGTQRPMGYDPNTRRHLNEPVAQINTEPSRIADETPANAARYESLRSDQSLMDHGYTELQISPAIEDDGYLRPVFKGTQSQVTAYSRRSYQDASVGNEDATDKLPLYKL